MRGLASRGGSYLKGRLTRHVSENPRNNCRRFILHEDAWWRKGNTTFESSVTIQVTARFSGWRFLECKAPQ